MRHGGLVTQWHVGFEFSGKETNQHPLHWKADPEPLDHWESHYIYLLICTTCWSFGLLFFPPVYWDFRFLLNSFCLETFYKTFITLVCWWWCCLVVVACLRKYSILFLICIFLGYRILSQLCFSQQLRCGASVPWRALFHLPNLLSSPFFVLLCLFFLLVTFLWLIVLIHELWCAFVELSYFLSSS